MASIKKKSSGGGGGANWMDTYGDMVTLLLCFFVLLYSISTIDQEKWLLVVQSFNRDAILSEPEKPTGPMGDEAQGGGDGLPLTSDDVQQAMTELSEFLQAFAAAQNAASASDSVSVSQGDGYIFISFDDAVFFDGDSAYLRKDGRDVLDGLIPALSEAGPYIDELRVLGHTAQAYPDRPNPATGDRYLASNRATAVTIYLQENIPFEQLHPGRLISMGMGQWRPVAPNDNSANRAKNRRVELIISGRDVEDELNDSYRSYYTMSDQATGNTTEFSNDGNATVSYYTSD